MTDWRDVMEAREDADQLARNADRARLTNAEALIAAVDAVRLELRALGKAIVYASDVPR